MRILWTISNWKWTGPVAPSLDLARAVAAAGHDVRVEVGRPPSWERCEAGVLREDRGLEPAEIGLRLHKHAFALRDLPDVRRLAAHLGRDRPDAIVTTLANDHRTALRAARRAGGPSVARLLFSDGASDPPPRELASLRVTPRIYVFAEAARRRLEGLGLEPARLVAIAPPLDVLRLRGEVDDPAAARRRLGVPEDAFLFGIVARMQTHRRYEMLWEAAAAFRDRGIPFRIVVLGRGTKQEEVGRAPVRALGLEDHVLFAGYLRGAEYASAVASFDAQIFLVPGSDPTCRALREGMALGVPSLTTRRGLLPSIVADGETGLTVDESVEAMTAALARLADDPGRARRMGEAAASRADALFDAPRVAARFLEALNPAGGAPPGTP